MNDPSPHSARPLRVLAPSAAVVTLTVVAIVSALALVVLTAQTLLLVFAGLLFAVLLSTAADALSHWLALPRGLALGLVGLAIIVAMVGASLALWPAISEQTEQLAQALPNALQEVRAWLAARAWGSWLLGRADPQQIAQNQAVVQHATGAITSTAGATAGLLVIVFVGVYVAAQPSLYHRGVCRLVPVPARDRCDRVIRAVAGVLRWWLIGKLLSMALVGVLTTCALWLLDVPLALTFGLIAAALTFVPNFGPILSVAPPALLVVGDDPRLAAYVVGAYLAIQTVESYAVTPLIQRRTVALPPALTIAAQVALGSLVGPLGVAVATPLTAAAMTITRLLYVKDLLEGDHCDTPDGARAPRDRG